MKRTLLIIILIPMFLQGSSQTNEFIIKGTINPKYDGRIIHVNIFRKDTILCIAKDTIKNGKFYLKGPANPDEIAYFYNYNFDFKPYVNFPITPILEAGTLNIEINDTVPVRSKVYGTYLNDEFNLYRDSLSKTFDKSQSNEYNYTRIAQFRKRFFTKHNNDMAGYKAFTQNIATNDSRVIEYYNCFSDRLKQNPDLKSKVQSYKKEVLAMKMVGKKVIDYSFKDKNGRIRKLSDYTGKSDFLYVDFWASWCAPCRESLKYVKESYSYCKQKGLEVLGISIDEDLHAWKKALQDDKYEWEQLVVKSPKEIDKVKEKYNIMGIPFSLLLDKKGTVLAVNMHGRSLKGWLDGYLKYKKKM